MSTERKLKLLLFGATRHTGWYFMHQVLEAGHEVTAIIRNPVLFNYTHPNLKVVKGDALQLNTFEKEVAGKDAIISSLGISPADFRKPAVVCSQGVKNMIDAMQKTGVKRIMCVSASALDTNPKMGFLVILAAKFLQWLLKTSYGDLRLMEKELRESNLDWTVVRPPKLNDGTGTGKYRVAVGTHLSWPLSINREDLAHYLSHHIEDKSTYGKVVEVAY